MKPIYDEVFKSEFHQSSDGKLTRVLSQPSEEIILNRNKELRKNPGAIKDLSFGRMVGSIPLNDWEMLCRKYPALTRGDSKQMQAQLMKILNSEEGKKYLVQEKKTNRIVV